MNTFKGGQVAYKIGASSGATIGLYSEYRSVTFMDHDRQPRSPSFEHQFIAKQGNAPFATHGDAGAVVFNEQGQSLGSCLVGTRPSRLAMARVRW